MAQRKLPTRWSNSSRGFTLAEALATLFLVGTALALVASLASELSRNTRFHRTQQALTEAALVTLESIRSEVAQSVSIDVPGPGLLTLERVDPDVERFPDNATDWTPREPSKLLRIQYELNQSELQRTINGVTRVLAKDATDFHAERTGSLLVLRLAIANNGRKMAYRLGVYLPLERTL